MKAPLLQTEGLSFFHPGGFRLEGVSLRIEAGEHVALAGPNGAGKSTLLKLLAGLVAPTEGRVLLDGAAAPRGRERARLVAWVPQEMDAFFPVLLEDFVRMGFHPRRGRGGWTPAAGEREELDRLLEQLALAPLRRREMGDLSGGERRRALLARGLAQGARLLLLDEPTTHMDPRHQRELLSTVENLRRAGVAVVTVLHDLNLALEACPRLVLLRAGRVLYDGAAAAVTAAALEDAYGLSARIRPGAGGEPGHVRFTSS